MSEATMVEPAEPVEVQVPDDVSELLPQFERISPDAARTCDRHSSTYALVKVTKQGWKSALELCGNCARKGFGYEHTKAAEPENNTQGSAH